MTNTMLVGCNDVGGLALINLADGTTIKRYPEVNTDDVIGFDSANRRWYTGSGGNGNDGGKCKGLERRRKSKCRIWSHGQGSCRWGRESNTDSLCAVRSKP